MHESISHDSVVTSLYWLAFILTGCQDISIKVTAEVVSSASGNLRRAVIIQSIAAQGIQLRAARAHYKRQAGFDCERELTTGLDAMPDFFEVRDALLAIDLFPRHALLLTFFEGFSVRDAASYLGCNEQSIREARSDGVLALTRNMMHVLSL